MALSPASTSESSATRLPSVLAWWATWATTPALLVLPLLGSRSLLERGVSPALAVTGVVFACSIFLLVLQRLHPREARWRMNRGDFFRDLLHSAVWHGALPPLFRALAFGSLTAAGVWVSQQVDIALWPTALPWFLQVFLALLIGEFAAYWIHRGCHEFAPLWRLHVLHHSSDELNVLSTGRNHPFNVGASVVAQFAPLFFLGCPPEILALHGVFTGVNGALQHANVYMRTGFLSWVIATSELHFWHHSEAIAHSNANYGSNLIVWDVLFGTRKLPSAPVTTTLGLPHASPRTFFGQLSYPFTFSRWASTPKPARES